MVDGVSVGAVSSYVFENVRTAHTLKAVFEKTEEQKPENPYGDLDSDDWFYNSVVYATRRGFMNGTGYDTFGPNIGTSRAMIVTILWRLEKEPAAGGGKSGVFIDVTEDEWYTEAIEMAAANGIVVGYDMANFGPNDGITREQFAAILYRYAVYKGYDVSARSNLAQYSDAGKIDAWAVDAVQWAWQRGSSPA